MTRAWGEGLSPSQRGSPPRKEFFRNPGGAPKGPAFLLAQKAAFPWCILWGPDGPRVIFKQRKGTLHLIGKFMLEEEEGGGRVGANAAVPMIGGRAWAFLSVHQWTLNGHSMDTQWTLNGHYNGHYENVGIPKMGPWSARKNYNVEHFF